MVLEITVGDRNENNEVSLSIKTEAGRGLKSYQQLIRELSKNVNIPGFRKGKVPQKIIEEQYDPAQLRAQALSEEFINDLLQEAFSQEDLNVVHIPSFDKVDFPDPEKEILMEATVELYPEVELADYKSMKVEAEIPVIDRDKRIQDTIDKITANNAAFTEADADATLQMDDELVLDFDGKAEIDGEWVPEPGMKAESFQVLMAPGRFIDGFLEQMVGMKVGEEKELELKFPDAYHAAKLAGKAAKFDVKVIKISKPSKPELNDEFAKQLGYDDLEALNTKVADEIDKIISDLKNQKAYDALIEQIIEKSDIKISEPMLEREIQSMIAEQINGGPGAARNQQFSEEESAKAKEALGGDEKIKYNALQKLTRSVVLTTVVKKEGIEVKEEEMQEAFNRLPFQGIDPSKIDMQQLSSNLSYSVLIDKTIKHLVDSAEINYKENPDDPESDK